MNISKTTLSDCSDYRITLHRARDCKGVIVTFDAFNTDLADAGFGTDFVLSQGYSNIYVAQRLGTQYQGLSLDDFRDAVFTHCAGRDVFTYGASLGGYCALYYAGVIDATAIAFSPRNSAHPLITGKSRGAKNKFKYLTFHHLAEGYPTSDKNPVIIYDNQVELDEFFINNWVKPHYPDSKVSVYKFAGHETAKALLKVGMLKTFFAEAVQGRALPCLGDAYESSITKVNKSQQLVQLGDYGSAVTLLEEVLRNDRNNVLAAEVLCSALRLTQRRKNFNYDLLSHINNPDYHKGYFDDQFYLNKYRDVRESTSMSKIPFLHFMIYGAFEGRIAGLSYNGEVYLKANNDIARAKLHPFAHYIRYGRKEGRVATCPPPPPSL